MAVQKGGRANMDIVLDREDDRWKWMTDNFEMSGGDKPLVTGVGEKAEVLWG